MSLEKAHEMKNVVNLENEIGRMIKAFEAETGLSIGSIRIVKEQRLVDQYPRFVSAQIVTDSL